MTFELPTWPSNVEHNYYFFGDGPVVVDDGDGKTYRIERITVTVYPDGEATQVVFAGRRCRVDGVADRRSSVSWNPWNEKLAKVVLEAFQRQVEAAEPEPVAEEPSPVDWVQRRAEGVVRHEAGERVVLSLLEGSPVECWDDRTLLGVLTKVEDYGHDRAFRFTFEYESGGAVRYFDSGTTVQRGSISEPAHSNWASD